jgi:hypothetical protein
MAIGPLIGHDEGNQLEDTELKPKNIRVSIDGDIEFRLEQLTVAKLAPRPPCSPTNAEMERRRQERVNEEGPPEWRRAAICVGLWLQDDR